MRLFDRVIFAGLPGSIHIRILPPIRTVGMSKAEQKQLPEAVRQTILAQL